LGNINHWHSYLTEDESNLLHLGLAVRYSEAKLPLVGRTESEFYLSPVFVETPEIQADHLLTYDLELYWRKGPVQTDPAFLALI